MTSIIRSVRNTERGIRSKQDYQTEKFKYETYENFTANTSSSIFNVRLCSKVKTLLKMENVRGNYEKKFDQLASNSIH